MSVKYTAQAVIDIAKSQIGYLEKASNSNLDSATGNAGYSNFTKFARDLAKTNMYNGNKNGYEWCDVFNDWCHYQAALAAGGTYKDAQAALYQPDGGCGAGCDFSYGYYKNNGRASSSPSVGAQIFFVRNGEICHTGLVTGFDSSTVYTIEGNTSGGSSLVSNGGGVFAKSYSRNSSYIYGYGLPNYAASGTATTTPVSANTSTSTGSASATVATEYKNVSKKLTAYSFSKKWCNGSTPEPVFANSALTISVGELDPYDSAVCLGIKDGNYIIAYNVEGGGNYKVGFVSYSGGVSAPTPSCKTYNNGSTDEPVFADTNLTVSVGSVNARESCECLGKLNGRYIVLYGVDGTSYHKVGVAEYNGGL